MKEQFENHFKTLDFSKTKDAWGNQIYAHSHIQAMWEGWNAAQGYIGVPEGWQPIETAPVGVEVLLFCPDRGCQSNPERIELGFADDGNGSHHSWATHWMPLPAAPKKEG